MNRDPFSPANGASFYDYLRVERPDLLPPSRTLPPGIEALALPHGTTVLALLFADGLVIAGDRMASDGHQVSSRHMDKVIQTDSHSAMAISGTVGPCMEMAKLFTTELEFYEKIEGRSLSLMGKANKLGQMVRGNLALAMQGLAVIPLFAGYDVDGGRARIFKYDMAGGRTEEPDFVTAGSGGGQARTVLKKRYRAAMNEAEAMKVALEALYDAAEEDLATAGPDLVRGIYPSVTLITRAGVRQAPDEAVAAICREFSASREGR